MCVREREYVYGYIYIYPLEDDLEILDNGVAKLNSTPKLLSIYIYIYVCVCV